MIARPLVQGRLLRAPRPAPSFAQCGEGARFAQTSDLGPPLFQIKFLQRKCHLRSVTLLCTIMKNILQRT